MVLNSDIINDLKEISGLKLDNAKDYENLSVKILRKTGRSIGVTTLKRLLGYIKDDRNTSRYTLNTIASFLDYQTWEEYIQKNSIDSEWCYLDNNIFINNLKLNSEIVVKYLNRTVCFIVIDYEGDKVLKVIKVKNSSLKKDDILYVHSIKLGEILEAEKVIRGSLVGNYRTRGEVTYIQLL